MLTDRWSPDPRLDRDPRIQAPRPLRPVTRPPVCSCGCAAVHEVARRTTTDGARLVVLSDDTHRLYVRGVLGADTEVTIDRFGPTSRDVVGWASVMTAAEVRAMLCRAAWGS